MAAVMPPISTKYAKPAQVTALAKLLWIFEISGTLLSGNARKSMPLRDRHLRLAIHFRELGPAVSGETEEKPPSMAFVAAFSNRQDDKSSNKYHSC